MPSKHWKALELWYCRDLGGERTGPMGKHLPDCDTDTFPISAEIKTRKDLPKWLFEMLEQAATESYDDNYIPVVIIHPHGNTPGNAIVLMWYNTFKKLRDWKGSLPLGA